MLKNPRGSTVEQIIIFFLPIEFKIMNISGNDCLCSSLIRISKNYHLAIKQPTKLEIKYVQCIHMHKMP